MTATHDVNPTTPTTPVLYLSLELGQKTWKLAFTIGLGQKPRLRTIAARDTEALMAEIRAAKKRFGLPEDAAVASCYEAGRDGRSGCGTWCGARRWLGCKGTRATSGRWPSALMAR